MLKKINRLNKPYEYTQAYESGLYSVDRDFALYVGKFYKDKNCPTRVGFVVSKKVHKRAVVRNRIKRLLRENVRLLIKNDYKPLTENLETLVFVARANSVNCNCEQVKKSILTLIDNVANKII